MDHMLTYDYSIYKYVHTMYCLCGRIVRQIKGPGTQEQQIDPRTGSLTHMCVDCINNLHRSKYNHAAPKKPHEQHDRVSKLVKNRAKKSTTNSYPVSGPDTVVRWMGAYGSTQGLEKSLDAEMTGLPPVVNHSHYDPKVNYYVPSAAHGTRDVAAEGQLVSGVTTLRKGYVGLMADPACVVAAYAGDAYTEVRGRKLPANRDIKRSSLGAARKAAAQKCYGYAEVTLRNPIYIAVVISDDCYPEVAERARRWAAFWRLPVVVHRREWKPYNP